MQSDIVDFVANKKTTTLNKDVFLKQKQHSLSLSMHKIVYARDDDPNDTVILRSFYAESPANFRQFGIKGKEDISILSLALLKLIDEVDRKDFLEKTRYMDKKQFKLLFSSIECKAEEIASLNFKSFSLQTKNNKEFRFLQIPTSDTPKNFFRIGITTTTYTEFSFFNYVDGEMINGIYLFTGEVYKLLKYLNTRFSTLNDKSFVYRTLSVDKDDFF